jgi:hypothetical protein
MIRLGAEVNRDGEGGDEGKLTNDSGVGSLAVAQGHTYGQDPFE